jgi:nicotinate-nucleotide pyrophosphorylase (carboxylating)
MPVTQAKLPDDIAALVRNALAEDIGSGDITAALIPADTSSRAKVISRDSAVICGTAWFDEVFRQLDERVSIDWQIADGDTVTPDQTLCLLQGPARSLLSGERCALNLLQTLSGTATQARRYVDAIAGTGARILDTRKTLPGLRTAQKYAVACGGGHNHRIGLFDAYLIKENHILAAGSIAAAVAQARANQPGAPVEVEVEDLEQLQQALEAGVDQVLLDNMALDSLRAAVELNAGRARLEASGGVTLDTVRAIADTGVDFISVGSITKHLHATDLSMRFQA